MNSLPNRIVAIVSSALALFLAAEAHAQQYTFTKIVSGRVQMYSDFSINNNGEVAFVDYPGPSPLTSRAGVYIWKDGAVREVAQGRTPSLENALAVVTINDAGAVAFIEFNGAVQKVQLAKDGGVTTVASNGSRFLGFRVPPVALDNNGQVYFIGAYSGGGGCLCAGTNGDRVIGRETDLMSPFSSVPAMVASDSGTVAILDLNSVAFSRVIVFENGGKSVVAGPVNEPLASIFNHLDINSRGDLVFSEWRMLVGESSIYLRSGGQVTRIVNSLNSLVNPLLVDQPQINDNGTVTYTSAGPNLHVLENGVSRKVIGVGDVLFDGIVDEVMNGVGNTAYLNNRGQIVFNYELTNGEMGLALATPAPATPVLTPGSFVNGASFAPGLVPGSWAQVKGTGLAPTTRIWRGSDFTNGNNLPTSLDGVEVKVNNLPAAVYYISPTQISFQMPAGVSGTVNVQVINNGVPSAAITGTVVNSAPALFGYQAGSKTFPAALYANSTTIVGDPAISGNIVRKALPGDRIALYATSIAPSPAGVIVDTTPLPGVTATIGSLPATVEFAGLVAVGQYQVNIVVPNLPPGDHAVVIHYSGNASQAGLVIPVGP